MVVEFGRMKPLSGQSMGAKTQQRFKPINFHRTRTLPGHGYVLVGEGSLVEPEDVLAEMPLPGKIHVFDLEHSLNLKPEDVESNLVRNYGETLQEGDIIAQNENALSRLVRAPVAGTLIKYRPGKVAIEAIQEVFQLKAGLTGEVIEVIPEFGAVLSATGYLLQGVWGNGRSSSGRLMMFDQQIWEETGKEDIDFFHEQPVVVTKKCLQADLLDFIAGKEVSGFVTGSLAPELLDLALSLDFPILVFQGFGDLPVDDVLFSFFQDREGSPVSIDACRLDAFSGQFPEVFLPDKNHKSAKTFDLRSKIEAGQAVRILAGEAQGLSGEVITISEKLSRFESGLALSSAVILLPDGQTVRVAVKNLQPIT
jgi:hypothetical protein